MKCYTTEELKALLDEAYLCGWMASAEGWNHEHPGNGHTFDCWESDRDKDVSELLHRDAGGYNGKGEKA